MSLLTPLHLGLRNFVDEQSHTHVRKYTVINVLNVELALKYSYKIDLA